MTTRPGRVPLWAKLAYTAFVAVLVPYYWAAYGPTNFLYYCDLALLMGLAAAWTGRALLASGRIDEAKQAIQEAADKGHVRAVYQLGYIAASGMGAAPDLTKANSLYAQASDKGDPYAMTALGRALFDGVGVQRDTGGGDTGPRAAGRSCDAATGKGMPQG